MNFSTDPNWKVFVPVGFGVTATNAFFTSKTLLGGITLPVAYCAYIVHEFVSLYRRSAVGWRTRTSAVWSTPRAGCSPNLRERAP